MEPNWLNVADVVAINEAEVAETGELFALARPDMLESGLDAPRNRRLYEGEEDVLVLGVCLLLAIAPNHPFAQGNKRTAFTALNMFLELNGYAVDIPDRAIWGDEVVSLVLGRMTEMEFVARIEHYVVPLKD
ncbi:type II toxin-antitoxin system death-on-curing family toxin [Salinarimonas chemoclinalis]|uniref:type II toxin-antitoxin system death-on-curing family toxin n=1 Tax=Salinarimonas chemoclinalis TaxID=3241599 RepID=UPI003557FD0F